MAQRVKTDWILYFTILGTLCLGLGMLYSASTVMAELRYGSSLHYVVRQLAWVLASVFVLISLRKVDYRELNCPGWVFGVMSIILTLLIVVFFVDARTHRWFRFGSFGFQPSELAKPALAVFLAFFVTLRARKINSKHTLLPASMAVGLLTGFVLVADVGTALVLAAMAAVVFFVAGLEWRYIWVAAAMVTVFVIIAIAMRPYRVVRLVGFYDPEYKIVDWWDPSGKTTESLRKSMAGRDPGYHLRQSLIAVGSGGPLGLGPMQGRQKLLFLPEPHTDFIYAVIAEELGLWGTLLVLGAFVVIIWRGLRLYFFAADDFGRYLALGVVTMIAVQSFMNISVVLGMVPTKGIPLPLISYGGSSLLSTMISLGLLLSVSENSG